MKSLHYIGVIPVASCKKNTCRYGRYADISQTKKGTSEYLKFLWSTQGRCLCIVVCIDRN